MIENKFTITANVWIYSGVGAWHFITLSKKDSDHIRNMFGVLAAGFGSLPVTVTIGKTTWNTSIFPEKKAGSYLLPLKAEVRKKEKIIAGDTVTLLLEIRV